MARVVLFARMFTKSNVLCCDFLYLYIQYTYTHAFMQFLDFSAFRYQEEPAKQWITVM